MEKDNKTAAWQLKKEIRCTMLDARKSLTDEELAWKSSAICRRLAELPEFAAANLVMVYMDIRNEVRTGEFIAECFERGKRVALPVVFDARKETARIAAYEVVDVNQCTRKGSFGICEPDIEITEPVKAEDIDFIVVPGVAFDCCMQRIGYGAGYYDRFLKLTSPGCLRAGAAFEIQLSDGLPCEEHDTGLDMIVTESRVIRK